MLLYNLDIRFGFGQIDIDTYKGYVDPHTDIQGSFKLETYPPELSLSNTFPKIVDIDISHCRADMGFPQPYGAAIMWRDEAKFQALEYIGAKAAEGDALMAIEKGITIGDIVERECFPEPPELNIDAVPKNPPKITFEMGRIQKQFYLGTSKVDVADKPVNLDYDRAKVTIGMDKDPYIVIKAVPTGKNIDSYV